MSDPYEKWTEEPADPHAGWTEEPAGPSLEGELRAPAAPTLSGTESAAELSAKLSKAWPHESRNLPTPPKSDAQQDIDSTNRNTETLRDTVGPLVDKATFGTLGRLGSGSMKGNLAAAQSRSPIASTVGQLGGYALQPVPGGSLLAQGAFLGGANELGDAKDLSWDTLKRTGKATIAGAAGGGMLQKAGKFGKALEGRGGELAGKAMSRVEEEALANQKASLDSTRGMSGKKTTDYFANQKRLQDSLSNPLTDPELAAKVKELLASEDAKFTHNRALQNALENHSRLGPAIEEADLAHATNQAFWTPEQLEARKQEILNKSGVISGALEVGKRVVPSLVGGAVGHALGHELTGGALGTAVGAVSGKPGTIIKNRMLLPGFQKSLGEAQQKLGRGISAVADHAGGVGQSLARPTAQTLAEYLDLMDKDKAQ